MQEKKKNTTKKRQCGLGKFCFWISGFCSVSPPPTPPNNSHYLLIVSLCTDYNDFMSDCDWVSAEPAAGKREEEDKKNAYLIKKSTAGCQCGTRALENFARCSGNRKDGFRWAWHKSKSAHKLFMIFSLFFFCVFRHSSRNLSLQEVLILGPGWFYVSHPHLFRLSIHSVCFFLFAQQVFTSSNVDFPLRKLLLTSILWRRSISGLVFSLSDAPSPPLNTSPYLC